MKQKIYFDMDGVLAAWNQDASLEEVATKGYFTKCKPIEKMLAIFNRLADEGYSVHILSSVFCDDHSKEDKLEWLSNYLPALKRENIHFSEYGKSKADFVNAKEKDVLIDDFTPNLFAWTGRAIKLFNGINGTKGTWNGYSVSVAMTEDILYNQLVALINI